MGYEHSLTLLYLGVLKNALSTLSIHKQELQYIDASHNLFHFTHKRNLLNILTQSLVICSITIDITENKDCHFGNNRRLCFL